MFATYASHPILLNFITLIECGEECKHTAPYYAMSAVPCYFLSQVKTHLFTHNVILSKSP